MSENDELKQIEAALRPLPMGPSRRIPTELRRRIARYARRRLAGGLSREAIAKELGVSSPTLVRVLQEEAPPAFVPVRTSGASRTTTASLTVRGPAGLTIEGLDIEGLVTLLRGLS